MAEQLVHPFPPLFNSESRVLILGSFPSVKSREAQFFYGHPQNRFWKLIPRLFDMPEPQTIEEKKALILSYHLALWDTIRSCTITGSSDSSIKDAVPNDLRVILDNSCVERIFCNGAVSYNLYQKYTYPITHIKAQKLPSSSPANAAWTLDRLTEAWRSVTLHL